MTSFRMPRRIAVACQIAIGAVLLASALAKLGDAATLAQQIRHYRMVPVFLENALAITLPWIELVTALAILLRIRPRAGAAVGAGLMGVFVVAVAAALVRGLDIECGCFGTADAARVGLGKLLVNLGLLLVGLAGAAAARVRGDASPPPGDVRPSGSLP